MRARAPAWPAVAPRICGASTVLAVVLALVTWPAHAEPAAPSPLRSATAEPAGLPELIARAKPSVVLIGTYNDLASPRFGFRGTGFAVGQGQSIVTNAHVLPPPEEVPAPQLVVQVKTAAGDWEVRRVLQTSLDRPNDLALLEIAGPPLRPLTLKTQATAEGTDIAFIGFPLGGALGFSHVTHRGIISAITPVALPAPSSQALNSRNLSQLRSGSFDMLQLDATAYPGNSGGPVFDLRSGEVLGVINMVLLKNTKESVLNQPSGISYAIPIEHVQRLLQR